MKINPVTPNFTGMLRIRKKYPSGTVDDVGINTNNIFIINGVSDNKTSVCYEHPNGGTATRVSINELDLPIQKVLNAYADAEKNGIGYIEADAIYG